MANPRQPAECTNLIAVDPQKLSTNLSTNHPPNFAKFSIVNKRSQNKFQLNETLVLCLVPEFLLTRFRFWTKKFKDSFSSPKDIKH